MSYNDPTDVQAALETAPTPPTATTAFTRSLVPFSVPADPLPNKIAAPSTPVGIALPIGGVVGGTPAAPPTVDLSKPPVQTQRRAASASVQLVPVPPTQPPAISALLQTPTAAAQTPSTTTPGVLVQ